MQRKVSEVYARIYQALDASVAVQACLPSTEATLQRTLADFRKRGIDEEGRRHLEAISKELQALQVASMASDSRARALAREQLSACAERWIQRLPMH